MVKASYTKEDGTKGFLFGLSAMNIELLKQGKPIQFSLEPLGGSGDVFIMYGETEADIAAVLSKATEL